MKINTVGVVAFLVGIIITYSAVKDFDPRDVIKNALGGETPVKQSGGGSGTGGSLGGLPGGGVLGNLGKTANNAASQAKRGIAVGGHNTAHTFDSIRHGISHQFDNVRHGIASVTGTVGHFFKKLFGR